MQRKAKKPRKHGKRRVRRIASKRVATSADASTGEGLTPAEYGRLAAAIIAEETKDRLMEPDPKMNTVEVDETALLAEASAAVASAPESQVQPGEGEQPTEGERQATPQEIQQGYEVLFTGVVGWGSQTFAPNWAVTPQETSKLSSALAQACVLWFPDQPIPPKYIALLAIVGATAEIVASRRDPETGMLKPLNAKAATREAIQTEAA